MLFGWKIKISGSLVQIDIQHNQLACPCTDGKSGMHLVRSQLGTGSLLEALLSGERNPSGTRLTRPWALSLTSTITSALLLCLHSSNARGKHAGWNNLTVVTMPSIKGELFIREVCIADTQVYGYMQFRNISCQTCSSLLPRALLSHSFSMRFWGRGIYRVL